MTYVSIIQHIFPDNRQLLPAQYPDMIFCQISQLRLSNFGIGIKLVINNTINLR